MRIGSGGDTYTHKHLYNSNAFYITWAANFIPLNYQRNYDINFEYGQLFYASSNASRICCRRCFPDSCERDFQDGIGQRGREREREREKVEGGNFQL